VIILPSDSFKNNEELPREPEVNIAICPVPGLSTALPEVY
jgi:hypothetical protein